MKGGTTPLKLLTFRHARSASDSTRRFDPELEQEFQDIEARWREMSPDGASLAIDVFDRVLLLLTGKAR